MREGLAAVRAAVRLPVAARFPEGGARGSGQMFANGGNPRAVRYRALVRKGRKTPAFVPSVATHPGLEGRYCDFSRVLVFNPPHETRLPELSGFIPGPRSSRGS